MVQLERGTWEVKADCIIADVEETLNGLCIEKHIIIISFRIMQGQHIIHL